jgi:hypothetical protein
MGLSFVDRHLFKIEWTDAFQAGRIYPELIGIGPALVMLVYPALRAEIMLGLPGVELIERQQFLARSDRYILERR